MLTSARGGKGSGKSHSTSVLLESCLVKDERLGTLPEPLSALVCVHVFLGALIVLMSP